MQFRSGATVFVVEGLQALGAIGFSAACLIVAASHRVPPPMDAALVALAILAPVFVLWVLPRLRGRFIRAAPLPVGLYEALRKKYPHLSRKECELAAHALRHFFLAYLHGGRRFVAMPSQAADELWHAFILHTRTYAKYCGSAFGGFLHHTPAVALGARRDINAGLRRCWWYACLEENINPRRPTRLPLLFALDAKLAIPDGFRYALHCHGPAFAQERVGDSVATQCAGDFGDPSIDGSTEGFGDGDGSVDGGADGGGDGCGGGCGGD